jgi:hypothetical protein
MTRVLFVSQYTTAKPSESKIRNSRWMYTLRWRTFTLLQENNPTQPKEYNYKSAWPSLDSCLRFLSAFSGIEHDSVFGRWEAL